MGSTEHCRVALLLNLQIGYCRRAIMGIAAYARHRGWLLEEMSVNRNALDSMAVSKPDGVIAHVLGEKLGRNLEQMDVPVINLSSNHESLALPTIDADQAIVGQMAAEYFWELGYQHYAYFGSATAAFSREREAGYQKALQSHRVVLDTMYLDYTLRPPYERDLHRGEESVSRWLEALPKPVAVFCSNDEHARLLSSLCQMSAIPVPDQVAILGVDNDETMCQLSSPPLSSVDNPAEKIGYRAAAMLNEMMSTQTSSVPSERVKPPCIIERASTERFAAEDPVTRKAIDYIERSLKDACFSVNSVAEYLGISRRSLERLFQKKLGITILAATQRARIHRAKALLRTSSIPIHLIATECGFSNHRRFEIVFRSSTKMTPSEFRNYYHFTPR